MPETQLKSNYSAARASFGTRINRGTLWEATCSRFLDSISARQRDQVATLLHQMHNGGSGLRDWISAIALRGAPLPERIPEAIIHVYLTDPEAAPLHDCEGCGIAIPVRPSRLYGLEGDPDEIYFSTCPGCGSRTGLFVHFTRHFEDEIVDNLRRRPR